MFQMSLAAKKVNYIFEEPPIEPNWRNYLIWTADWNVSPLKTACHKKRQKRSIEKEKMKKEKSEKVKQQQ